VDQIITLVPLIIIIAIIYFVVKKRVDNPKSSITQDIPGKRISFRSALSRKNNWDIVVDEENRILTIIAKNPKDKYVGNDGIFLNFNDLIECEVLEDNSTIMKGGIGRAVAGGILLGGVGAIVGATTRKSADMVNSLTVRIVTANVTDALIMVDLIHMKLKRNHPEYKNAYEFAQKLYATVTSIISSNEKIGVYENMVQPE